MPKSEDTQYPLDQSPFYCLRTKRKLAKLLGISINKMTDLTQSDQLYTEIEGKRLIERPCLSLKNVQKRIANLLARIKLPDFVHAPARKRSYISNARSHIKSLDVVRLDIEKYFLSTPSQRIYWFFHQRMKCSSDVAGVLTKISTFNGHLPTGSPSSPILSYFARLDMWESIETIVNDNKCVLTVYIDDVTISGKHVSGNLIWKIKKKFKRYGLTSNKRKEQHYFNKRSCEITGVVLTRDGHLKAPNRQHLKAHNLRKSLKHETRPEEIKKIKQRLKGLSSQILQIERAK
jgi:hypothetical protein